MVASAIETYQPQRNLLTGTSNRLPRSIFEMSEIQFKFMDIFCETVVGSDLSYSKPGGRKLSKFDVRLIVLKGLSVGLNEMASLDLIDIIQGKAAFKPQGMLALIYNSGMIEDVKFSDDGTTAVVMVKRRGMPEHTSRFSADDAKRMGLLDKDNWKRMPSVMRQWRAISAMARVLFPDIIQGLYMVEEIDPDIVMDTEGNIVSYPASTVQRPQAPSLPDGQSSDKKDDQLEPPKVGTWADEKALAYLVQFFREKNLIENLTLPEMAGFAGIATPNDYTAWNKAYLTGAMAKDAIIKAFETKMNALPPATAKSRLNTAEQIPADDTLNFDPSVPESASQAFRAYATKISYKAIAGQGGYAELHTETGIVRLYGAGTAFELAVKENRLQVEHGNALAKAKQAPGQAFNLPMPISFEWTQAEGYRVVASDKTLQSDMPF